ncbi:MAG: hypothetical protein JNJ71_09005 [Rubrivivax sp.]|nr:hypothetical protein [Rubrivivax sp.]
MPAPTPAPDPAPAPARAPAAAAPSTPASDRAGVAQPSARPRAFPCPACGASLAFDPQRQALACAACGHARVLPEPTPADQAQALREQDYREALQRLARQEPSLEASVVGCPACGAQSRFEGHVVGDRCAFCASPLLLDQPQRQRLIEAQALLPFSLDRAAAQQVFARWVGSRWFAPDALKQTVRQAEGIHGVYTPWWTYDASTFTRYRGERGTRRQVADHSPGGSARAGNGARWVTDWQPVSGAVTLSFDDILVVGSPSIPAHLARVLDRWSLQALRPPAPEYLAGFTVEVYRQGLEPGFAQALDRMEPAIDSALRRDIGGDEQRILAHQTTVDDIRFKHLLLPVWVGSYRFGGKPYQVVVNGQSGEVEGDRPYSTLKIALAVLAGLLLLAVVAALQSGA